MQDHTLAAAKPSVNPMGYVATAWRSKVLVATIAVFCLAAALRVGMVGRASLGADEIFSLAMATGHSLEHPASLAQPALGDYVEALGPRPAAEYRHYAEHGSPIPGPQAVVRAVRLSDTNPPLYYLLLWAWTHAVGTGDDALRAFSVAWALGCFPLIVSLARTLGGRSSVLPAGILFALSPLSLYYSVEGRMYSMMWFLVVGQAWLTLQLHRNGPRPVSFGLWVVVGAAGLVTHYFYAFALAACCAWLLWYPGRFPRTLSLLGWGCIGLLVLPWYVELPANLSRWWVTKGWLYEAPEAGRPRLALRLAWSYVTPFTRWWPSPDWTRPAAFVVFAALGVATCVSLSRKLVSPRPRLIWLALAAPWLGVVLLDSIMGTYASGEIRYASAGMPAAVVLIALALGALHPWLRAVLLAGIVAVWLPSVASMSTASIRGWAPFREVAALVDASPASAVVVHSIPSGVIGVARYLQQPREMLSWVGQLKQRRVPEDIESLTNKHERIVLVKIHTVNEPAPEEDWLRRHARLEGTRHVEAAELLFFATGRRLESNIVQGAIVD